MVYMVLEPYEPYMIMLVPFPADCGAPVVRLSRGLQPAAS